MASDDRFSDLNKQGFMRRAYQKPKAPKKPKRIVRCERCQDWHWEGKHTKKKNPSYRSEGGEDNTMLYVVGGVVALYFLYKYSISQGVPSSAAVDGTATAAPGTPAAALQSVPVITNQPSVQAIQGSPAPSPIYSGALSLFTSATGSGNTASSAPVTTRTVTTPSTPAPSQTAIVPRAAIVDTNAMQAQVNAMIAAGQVSGLSWQQEAAMQAGLPYSTTAIASAAIAAANKV